MLAPLLALFVVQAAQAESSLAAGDIRRALRLAEQVVAQQPQSAAAHMLLGRAHFARPVIGRFPALDEFRTAARLAPNDPEPWYWQMKVGFYLRSDDGDYIARLGLLGLFAVTPNYADAWQRFHDIYQSPSIWRQAERALARHGEQPIALEHRAELLIALNQADRAESLLAIVAARGDGGVKTNLLRSEAAFLAGHKNAGYAWHDSALAHADADSSEALWEEVSLIASPEEAIRYPVTLRSERRGFFAAFWQRRDPNLLTTENERLPEHYARRAEVRRMYRLLHPQRSTYRSPPARALKYFDDREELQALARAGAIPAAASDSSDSIGVVNRVAGLRVEALQDSALVLAAHAGATAQGLVYLRHGPPDRQASCAVDLRRSAADIPRCGSFLDYETWLYFTPDGPLSILFAGNEYFKPATAGQVRSAWTLIQTDRTALPAPLPARAWSAFFKSRELELTDAYYRTSGDSAAIALWDETGAMRRTAGAGLLRLTVPPGRYSLGLDVDSAGALGRIRRHAAVPDFSASQLALSSLVLMPFGRGAPLPDRETALRGMPVDLAYPAATPLATYVEIYGLATDLDGRSQYHVRYAFEPARSEVARFLLGAARPVVFEFDRAAIGSRATEELIIEPDKLPAGRYRVSVAVTDLAQNVKSQSAAIVVTIR